MPLHDYQCAVCGAVFEAVAPWDQYRVACPSDICNGTAERIYNGAQVIDDALPGGARWMHNLGDTPVWVESKTQFREELATRGLVQAERSSYNRDDKSPYATRTRLRPGQRDPFLGR